MPETSASALLSGIREWVEIETPTSDPTGVNRLMTLVAGQFAAIGAHVERIPGRDNRGDHLSITSPWAGPRGENSAGILVLCHLDTVHPSGTLDRKSVV